MKTSAVSFWRRTAGARAAIQGGAVKVTSEMGQRLQKASDAFEAPPGVELDGLYSNADLPPIDLDDPMGSLVARLDRESDLLRGLALRALSRAGWADRVAQGAGLFMGLGAAALAIIAGLGALFGAEGASSRALLLFAALGALVVGAAVVTWISASIRKAQRDIARDAMERADLVEIRLHRISVVAAIGKCDDAEGRKALSRLERDVSAI